jgi:very-short-patch-repair endonuclease
MLSRSKILTRSALLKDGHSRGHIDYQVESGRWQRVHPGIYIEKHEAGIARSIWAAHLLACGPSSALSHRSAAAIHGLDSTLGWGIEVDVSTLRGCGVRSCPPHFRVWLTSNRIEPVTVEGFPVTSRARTMLDVAVLVDDIECERVLESVLRGANPKRPDLWRTEVLTELLTLVVENSRHRGVSRLRRVLALRPPGCRPTGSFPETVLMQALRERGIEVIRQPTLDVVNAGGEQATYFPDLLIVQGRCIVEVDGSHHLEPQRARSDALRQNRLVGFTVFRYPASVILRDARDAAQEIAHHVQAVQNRSNSWTMAGRKIVGVGNHWSITETRAR